MKRFGITLPPISRTNGTCGENVSDIAPLFPSSIFPNGMATPVRTAS